MKKEAKLNAFVTWPKDWVDWSDSSPGRFTSCKRTRSFASNATLGGPRSRTACFGKHKSQTPAGNRTQYSQIGSL